MGPDRWPWSIGSGRREFQYQRGEQHAGVRGEFPQDAGSPERRGRDVHSTERVRVCRDWVLSGTLWLRRVAVAGDLRDPGERGKQNQRDECGDRNSSSGVRLPAGGPAAPARPVGNPGGSGPHVRWESVACAKSYEVRARFSDGSNFDINVGDTTEISRSRRKRGGLCGHVCRRGRCPRSIFPIRASHASAVSPDQSRVNAALANTRVNAAAMSPSRTLS